MPSGASYSLGLNHFHGVYLQTYGGRNFFKEKIFSLILTLTLGFFVQSDTPDYKVSLD